jgi:hypothetical protein
LFGYTKIEKSSADRKKEVESIWKRGKKEIKREGSMNQMGTQNLNQI